MSDPVISMSRVLTTAEVDAEIEDILQRPYSYVITPDEEIGGFAASVLEFPGCFSQGVTVNRAYANVRSTARVWLQALFAGGRPVPPPLDPAARLVPLEFPHDIYETVRRAAAAERLTVQDFVLRALTERFPPPRVHVVFEGRALCGKAGPPGAWLDGHKHVRLDEHRQATCEPCLNRAPEFTKLL